MHVTLFIVTFPKMFYILAKKISILNGLSNTIDGDSLFIVVQVKATNNKNTL